jgi:hypothetical protein
VLLGGLFAYDLVAGFETLPPRESQLAAIGTHLIIDGAGQSRVQQRQQRAAIF